MPRTVEVTELILRDSHQSLLATRMALEDMIPACEDIDQAGYWSVECWGGATYDACIRFLNEDPWVRLRTFRQLMPNSRLQMLLRGQNLLGYRHYEDSVIDRFVDKSAANGMDVFRVFDALNDIRNLKRALQAVRRTGKHAEGTICYTTSPLHTVERFVELAQQLRDLGCDSICIKDMAALLRPQPAFDIVRGIKKACGEETVVHVHVHSTTGVTLVSLMKAIEAGADIVDTAISPLAQGASQPATEAIVAALRGTHHDTGLDLARLAEIADYFYAVRRKYAEFESAVSNQIKTDVLVSQIPGGMLSNLVVQLRAGKAEDKLEAVLAEMPSVRADLGYPPLVTPTSQIVGSQAAFNVLTGKRYAMVPTETTNYVMGLYGEPPGPISDEVKRKVLGKKEPISCRPADLLEPGLDTARREIGSLARGEEDVLSYALFPDIARDYFLSREASR
jgi:methylmalonyl-CoA carboxyltransferase 5S subunit